MCFTSLVNEVHVDKFKVFLDKIKGKGKDKIEIVLKKKNQSQELDIGDNQRNETRLLFDDNSETVILEALIQNWKYEKAILLTVKSDQSRKIKNKVMAQVSGKIQKIVN